MRSEFYLEDPNHSSDSFEFEKKTCKWNSKFSVIFISLAIIAGGFAVMYLLLQPTEPNKQTAQKIIEPAPVEPIPESMTESTTWEASEPLIVESNKELNDFPQLIAETPSIDSNDKNKPILTKESQSQPPKSTPEKAIIVPEKQPSTSKKITKKPNPNTQIPKKPTLLPSKKPTQYNPNLEQPQPKPKETKLPTIPKEKPFPSIDEKKDWSIQWIAPYTPLKDSTNQLKQPFQLDPYLLTKEGILLSLVTQKRIEPDNTFQLEKSKEMSSTLIPLIQIEKPTNLETFVSQVHSIGKLIEQSTASEIHINLIEENSTQINKDIYILFTSLIHQTTQKLGKKLVLQRSTTQPDSLYLPYLQLVDGIQILTPSTPKETASQKPDQNQPLPPTIKKSIELWIVRQELMISREQIDSITMLNPIQKKPLDTRNSQQK